MKNWTLKGLLGGKYSTAWPFRGENHGQQNLVVMPNVDPNKVGPGCTDCAEVCPTSAILPSTDALAIDYGRCIGCRMCAENCRCGAIQMSSDFEYAAKSRADLVAIPESSPSPTEQLKSKVENIFGGSLHIRHVDAGSCNGCESEIQALTNPFYNLHRMGIFFTSSPRFADLLLVTGPVVPQMVGPLLRTYQAMPKPRYVIATGTCAISGAPFDSGYAAGSGVSRHLPVDIYIPGCPPNPAALIHGLLLLGDRVEQKLREGIYEH